MRDLVPGIPRDLERICLTCLAKEPGDRYLSAAALQADLARFRRPTNSREKAWRVAQLWRWLRQPQRLRDAGIWMMTLNGAILLWWAWMIPYFHFAEGITVNRGAIAMDGLIVAFCFNLPQVFIGAWTVLGKRWAVWAGLIWSFTNVVFSLVGQSGLYVPFGNLYEGSAPIRIAMFSLMTALYLIELLLSVAAAISISSSGNRKKKSDAQK